jgi:hypothetical protein
MLTFIEAIARQEGFYVPGSRANRNNNPGNIEWGAFAEEHGATRIEACPAGETPRFAFFPDAATGFDAMRALLADAYSGLPVEAALNKWAPPIENQTSVYVADVCAWTGLTPDTILNETNIG